MLLHSDERDVPRAHDTGARTQERRSGFGWIVERGAAVADVLDRGHPITCLGAESNQTAPSAWGICGGSAPPQEQACCVRPFDDGAALCLQQARRAAAVFANFAAPEAAPDAAPYQDFSSGLTLPPSSGFC